MKLLWKLSKAAIRYKKLYVIAILSTMCLTLVNLTAPRVLSRLSGDRSSASLSPTAFPPSAMPT